MAIISTSTASMIVSVLLVTGVIVGFICSTMYVANTTTAATKKNLIIAQSVVYGLLIVVLGLAAAYIVSNDLNEMNTYYDIVMPVSLVMSIVSLSATAMNRLASASTTVA